jgi:hypothetical protein
MVHCAPVTARFALLVAPSDPLVGSASARLESLGWLRNQMARRGFQVSIVGSSQSPLADLEAIAARISSVDSVLLHVSGRLVASDSIAVSATSTLALAALTNLLATRNPGYASVVLDLVLGEGSEDERDPVDLVSEAARSLGGPERGYSVLAGLRIPEDGADRIAFTRLAMPPIDDGGPPSTEVLLSSMHDRAAATGTNGRGTQSFVLLRGAPDATIDGLVAQALQAGDWRRVVELRLERAETLATVAQRADDLAGAARILRVELRDPNGAIEILEHARTLDPKRAAVLEGLRDAYEASGRAAPIDPDEYAKAFATHRRAGQMDAALLDAMVLEAVGAAAPEHAAMVERSRTVGPMQVLKPLDDGAWLALRAPGFDDDLAVLLAGIDVAAVAVRLERLRSSRRVSSLDSANRLGPESTVSAARTMHWAARVLGVECPDVYAGAEDGDEPVIPIPSARPSIFLAPRTLSGTSAKQLAFLAGRSLTWYRPEYHCMLYYPNIEELRELIAATLEIAGVDGVSIDPSTDTTEMQRALARHLGADARAAIGDAAARLGVRGEENALERWMRSAELTAARAGLLLCGELKTAMAGAQLRSSASGRPSAERVASDLVAFCASRAHAALRAEFLNVPT